MQKTYSLKVPGTVIAGSGCISDLHSLLKAEGKTNIAVFADQGPLKSGALDEIIQMLHRSFTKVTFISDVPPEPEDRQVRDIFDRVRNSGAQLIVAIGGGSVIDTSKIIAAMLTNPGYYDDLTDTSKILNPGVPLFAAPTSAGTGAEATPNAIILLPESKLKVGVVHPWFIPSKVLLDPMLTMSLPKSVTAATGLDAFCHCIETYISKKSNSFARLFALEGIKLISRSLRKAYDNGKDLAAREDMLVAAFYGGVAITSSSTVAVHALSYPLGGAYRIPHGVSNAILLPHVMAFNMDAILDEVEPIAAAMGINTKGRTPEELGRAVVDEIYGMTEYLQIPKTLKDFGVSREDIDFLTESASQVRRLLDQNPKVMSHDDIRSIYKRLL